jgi:hypothetical protein
VRPDSESRLLDPTPSNSCDFLPFLALPFKE